jgi:hypothetical protein
MYTVYAIKQHGKVLYVGKTVNLQRRKWEHTYRKKLDKTYSFEVLEDNLTKEEAKTKEEFYINKYDTFLNGWNRTAGEGTKKVKTKQGDGRFKKGNRMVEKRKIKKILCVETGEIYDSVKECAEDIQGTEYGIYKVCNGQNKTYKKMHFEYI